MIGGGSVEVAHRYAGVTVLQADLSGYTALSAKLSPEEVIVFMSDLFGRFDDLAVRGRAVHELKTISSVLISGASSQGAARRAQAQDDRRCVRRLRRRLVRRGGSSTHSRAVS